MHPLIGVVTLVLIVAGGYLCLSILGSISAWSKRRNLQLLVLTAPVASLGAAIGGLHHLTGHICLIGSPPWDYRLDVALALTMGLVAIVALAVGLIRLVLMHRCVARRGVVADAGLQTLAVGLANRIGAPRPRIRLCGNDRPLALTYGLIRPTVLLSTWMVEHLDHQELEAVLAHELGHVARRDYLLNWLALVLRDAFFYLPTSQAAYQLLKLDKEPACDDLAVHATRRPLALASALAKVWQQAVSSTPYTLAQPLAEPSTAIEERIERLLDPATVVVGNRGLRLFAVAVGVSGLAALLVLEAANAVTLLAPVGCGPVSALGRLFY